MAEWSKAAVSKTVNPHPGILGFESPSLRSMQSSKCAALSAAFFVKQDRQKLVFCKVPALQKNGLVVLSFIIPHDPRREYTPKKFAK